ncbi:holo-ACP synthase [Salipaludibacillus sp. LMS25]|jgi:holo-[acyl-carrier protein] synthase|uniref:holo-ACP synthase n=1 Tax=Salipaludibacillus sp. LMS25 TaxID=2924031 RepID=UPI0020D06EEA|nr:holo-ACP synthase [Salipaludibacillus sp. LMS25]UTR17018.1 holo-ACP synthase [Salipaludibacillus sp. LMS25]
MISGIGLDIVEMERIEAIHIRKETFAKRILTGKEYHLFSSLSGKRQTEFLAGRFAAKEAYAKAIGTGIGSHLSFKDIEIIPNQFGKPILTDLKRRGKNTNIHLSITHTQEFAAAQVVIEDEE